MKISYNILKELIDIDISTDELTSILNNAMLPVEEIEKTDDDTIFDVEITPNRPDLLGHIGVAWQLSAFLNISPPELKFDYETIKDENIDDYIDIEIKDSRCRRYSGIVVKDFEIQESPDWLKKRLESLDIRSINNAVDISNYVMMMTGHPIHTFDLNLLKDKKIIIRNGIKGEKILCLDEEVRELTEDDIVIADTEKAVAIAGVIGGEETGVNDKTTELFIESAYFIPKFVRYTARRLRVSTESSYRFERGADIKATILAAKYAAYLFYKMGGKIVSSIKDVKAGEISENKIKLRFERVRMILGAEKLSDEKIKEIIERLGIKILSSSDKFVECLIPSFRRDVFREIDIIEEIGILYGYNNIEGTIPSVFSGIYNDEERKIKNKIENILMNYGFSQVVNYSFLSEKEALISLEKRKLLKIKNPLSLNFEFLRASVLPSLLKNGEYNLNREQKGVKIFELGRIFYLEQDNVKEEEHLALLLAGESENRWEKNNCDIFAFNGLKGTIESIFNKTGKAISLKDCDKPVFKNQISFEIIMDNKRIGYMGEISDELKNLYGFDKNLFYAELYPSEFIDDLREIKYKDVPKYPSIWLDLSIIVSKETKYADIEKTIKKLSVKFLEEFYLLDVYEGENIGKDNRSISIRFIFRALDRTLNSEDAEKSFNMIKDELMKKYNVKIR
jgi:phenylalanyl-tRNA synthetase beta chain